MVFDPRNDLEGIDLPEAIWIVLPPLDFQIQQVAILSPEDIEVKVVANLEILTPGQVDRGDRVNGIGRLIEFVFLYLASFVTMNEPFLRGTIEPGLRIDDLSVFSLTEGEPGRCKRFGLDG